MAPDATCAYALLDSMLNVLRAGSSVTSSAQLISTASGRARRVRSLSCKLGL
jgi:hypothetical protein